MDQGWSALIAGAAGLAGAVIGGYFAKQGAVAGAKASADAIARQVKQQGRNEVAHWIRQERRNAYDEVLRAYGAFANALAAYRVAIENDQPLEETRRQAGAARNLLFIASSSTHLFGPEDVWAAVRNLRDQAHENVVAHDVYAHQRQAGGGPGLEEATVSLAEARESMTQLLVTFSQRSRETLLSEPNG